MTKYSEEFKKEAIRLSDEIGNKKAAAQLGLPYYTLADWRNHGIFTKPKWCVILSLKGGGAMADNKKETEAEPFETAEAVFEPRRSETCRSGRP